MAPLTKSGVGKNHRREEGLFKLKVLEDKEPAGLGQKTAPRIVGADFPPSPGMPASYEVPPTATGGWVKDRSD